MSRYYVWVNRGTETRPVPLQSEGYQGPYALATAKQYARIAASKGQYGRIVSSNTDPHALKVVRAYPAGGRLRPNHPQHAVLLAEYLNQDVDPADYEPLVKGMFGESADVFSLSAEETQQLLKAVEKDERRLSYWPCDTPAYRVFAEAHVPPPGKWYVHFTRESFSQFAYGASIWTGLSFSHCNEEEPRKAPDGNTSVDTDLYDVIWGFAFPADRSDKELSTGSWYGGKAARFLLFRSDEAVVAYHKGDNETQAIFVIGSEYDVITGRFNGSSGWVIETEDGELGFTSMGEIVDWANEHYPPKATRSGYRPNRLVQIPEREWYVQHAESVLAGIVNAIGTQLEEGALEYDQSLGDLLEEGYETDLYDGPRFKVVVQGPCVERPRGLHKYEPYFLRGSYSPREDFIEIVASSCRTAADWVNPEYHEARIRDLLDVYLHEQTHAHDRGVRQMIPTYLGIDGGRMRTGDRSVAEYVNLPVEVKGFARNVYEEAVRHADMLVSGKTGASGTLSSEHLEKYRAARRRQGRARVFEEIITHTPSWLFLVRSGLSQENQHRVLRDVYTQLDADGWVAAVDEALRAPALTANRHATLPASIERSRWATPNTTSDPPEVYQGQAAYVRARWPEAKLLGFGANGTVWDVGDRVVKYTSSEEEIEVYKYLLEQDIEGLIPQVFAITSVPEDTDEDFGAEGFIVEREAAEPVLQAFQTRPRKDQAALRRMLAALDEADDAPSRKTVLAAAKAAESVDGGEGFGSALRELWARGLVVHDLHSANLGVTQDGRIVAYDPGWFESV